MSKEINVAEASDWSEKEAKENLEYLDSRGRSNEVAEVQRVRSDPKSADGGDDTRGDLAGYDEDDSGDSAALFPADAPAAKAAKKSAAKSDK